MLTLVNHTNLVGELNDRGQLMLVSSDGDNLIINGATEAMLSSPMALLNQIHQCYDYSYAGVEDAINIRAVLQEGAFNEELDARLTGNIAETQLFGAAEVQSAFDNGYFLAIVPTDGTEKGALACKGLRKTIMVDDVHRYINILRNDEEFNPNHRKIAVFVLSDDFISIA